MKRILALLPGLLLLAQLWAQPVQAADLGQLLLQEEETKETKEKADGAELQLSAPSALLMEASTGQVIYEKNPDDPLPPASVTKVMTLLLIFDALEEGKIHLEVQTVDTLIKCIAVASANDACVAMAEKVRGSEEAFVEEMNQRAKELGMENTTFVNCNGLDAEGHLTTARDIALMSRELITSYPQVRDYCMIWMEDITHTTRKGTSTFGLSNTNKLVRHYEYATGLKTGSTSKGGFCISATAEKEGMELIGVIMAARTSKERTKDAVALLNYGFGKCNRYAEDSVPRTNPVQVGRGVKDHVETIQKEPFVYLDTAGADLSAIERKEEPVTDRAAPVKKGEKVGEAVYTLDGKEIGRVDILAAESVAGVSVRSAAQEAVRWYLL